MKGGVRLTYKYSRRFDDVNCGFFQYISDVVIYTVYAYDSHKCLTSSSVLYCIGCILPYSD